MTMNRPLTHYLLFSLLFWPLAALLTLVLSMPTALLVVADAAGYLPPFGCFFLALTTVSAAGLLFKPAMELLRQHCFRAALVVVMRRMRARTSAAATDAATDAAVADYRAQWQTLAGMCVLFGIHVFVNKDNLVSAQTHRPVTTGVRPFAAEADTLATVRALQFELHLNEHGVLRATRYLRQGYSVQEVRNLFAPIVRKY